MAQDEAEHLTRDCSSTASRTRVQPCWKHATKLCNCPGYTRPLCLKLCRVWFLGKPTVLSEKSMTFKDLWELLQETGMPRVHTERHGQGPPWPSTRSFSLAPFGAECAAVYAHRHGSRAADGPSLPALAGRDEHGSGYVSSTMDTSTVRTQKGKCAHDTEKCSAGLSGLCHVLLEF